MYIHTDITMYMYDCMSAKTNLPHGWDKKYNDQASANLTQLRYSISLQKKDALQFDWNIHNICHFYILAFSFVCVCVCVFFGCIFR